MRNFLTFCRKELIEGHRSKKIYVLIGIFMMFGMASPILARYMQEIISLAMGSGAPVLAVRPVWTDSWNQFYNNLAQIGAISIVLLFMGSVSSEKISKTAELTLTKNLSPAQFILAKYVAGALMAAAAFLPSLLLCWGYTYYLFDFAGQPRGIFTSAISYFMFAVVLLAVTILASAIAKTAVSSAIFAFGGYLLLLVSPYLPAIGIAMPGQLLSSSVSAISGIEVMKELPLQMLAAAILALICIGIAIKLFQSEEI